MRPRARSGRGTTARRSKSRESRRCWTIDEPARLPDYLFRSRLHVTKIDRFAKRSQRIAHGHELVRHVTVEIGGRDAAHHAIPLHFLRSVQLVAPGHAAGVEVRDPLDVALDRL